MNTPFSVLDILQAKTDGKKLVEITAYDYSFAKLIDKTSNVDMILVGDSLGMVVQGNPTPIPVTIDQMVYHTNMVSRAAEHAMVIGDMPFLSYQIDETSAVKNAGRLIQEGGANAVKLEGAGRMTPIIKHLVEIGIPVQGHLGLTPQSINLLGGWKVQGKTKSSAEKIRDQALELQEAGVFSIVLEGLPIDTARFVTEAVSVPTIGIGAGWHCDGQVLVMHDLLGLSEFSPRFAKRYADLGKMVSDAVDGYAKEVREGIFPNEEYSYKTRVNLS